ncbi:hypothetical protein ACOME3_002526 [Neoechinorhynchus agilis]
MIKFRKHFPDVSEKVEARYRCAYQDDILLQGILYVTRHRFCFNSTVLGRRVTINVPWNQVHDIRKAKIAYIFPTAIALSTPSIRYVFASFLQRDSAFNTIRMILSSITNGKNIMAIASSSTVTTNEVLDRQLIMLMRAGQWKLGLVIKVPDYTTSISTFARNHNQCSSLSSIDSSSTTSSSSVRSSFKRKRIRKTHVHKSSSPVTEPSPETKWIDIVLFVIILMTLVTSTMMYARVDNLEKWLNELARKPCWKS